MSVRQKINEILQFCRRQSFANFRMKPSVLRQAVQKVGPHNRGIQFPSRAAWTPVGMT